MKKFNVVGWFDIYVSDLNRAVSFYESILESKLEELKDPSGETQMMTFSADMTVYGAAGALVKSEYNRPGPGGTMIYFSVEDCEISQSRVQSAGGKVLRPKFSIGEFGWVTICEDSEGNIIGLNSMK